MKRLFKWLLSCKRWLILTLSSIPLLSLAVWLLTLRTASLILFVLIWFAHVALGMGAGWATVRLWYFRHHPLIRWVGVYMLAFIVDVIGAVILVFVARGVKFTWKFSAVMFVSTLVSNVFRAPLIIYLIRGPSTLSLPAEAETSGEKPPDYWLTEFRKIVREEVRRTRRATKASALSRSRKRR